LGELLAVPRFYCEIALTAEEGRAMMEETLKKE
jgi:hypothetical protein